MSAEPTRRLPTPPRPKFDRRPLSGFETCELVEELKSREGVETHIIGPSACVTVKADGPAIVFVVID